MDRKAKFALCLTFVSQQIYSFLRSLMMNWKKQGMLSMEIQCDAIIQVILSPREQKLAIAQGLMDISLIGDGDPSSPDTDKLWRLCGRSHMSIADLVDSQQQINR